MTPHTLTAPPTDRGYWRRLLAAVHPDRHGDHDLFIWVQGLHDHVAGDRLEPVVDGRPGRARRSPRAASQSDRVPFDQFANFEVLDGTRGAHVSVSGISGVATKTSFATFLVYAIFN